MLNITILGSTGSIGKQTLDIVRENEDFFKVKGLTANQNHELLYKQVKEFKPDIVAIANKENYHELKSLLKDFDTMVLCGDDGVIDVATYDESDMVVSAIVGIAGLEPTYFAISKGKKIALANKETLVTAGRLILDQAKQKNVQLIPVDSEHSAIFQCLDANRHYVEKIILTASGGPFRTKTLKEIKKATIEEALNHPNWNMGKKITIDSATLMNKGLEVIEAKWLFDMIPERIKVCVHPQSIIHSMVEYIDGSIIAQLGVADMRLPIQYALTYPERRNAPIERLNLYKMGHMEFEEPDYQKFPCLGLAYDALKQGDSACIVLNGANEIAVSSFLQGEIPFTNIYKLIYSVLESHKIMAVKSIEDVKFIDKWSRKKSLELKKRCE